MGSRSKLLRADAVALVTAATLAYLLDACGIPVAGVGFMNAHELALIAGLLLWCAAPRRCWHLSAAGVHMLFAAATIAHSEAIVAGGMVYTALAATAMHLAFIGLHGFAARGATTASGERTLAGILAAEAAFAQK